MLGRRRYNWLAYLNVFSIIMTPQQSQREVLWQPRYLRWL